MIDLWYRTSHFVLDILVPIPYSSTDRQNAKGLVNSKRVFEHEATIIISRRKKEGERSVIWFRV